MRAIPSAPAHTVTIERPGENPVVVKLYPPPLGHQAMVSRVYPAPVVYLNGKPMPDEAAMSEYNTLSAFVLLAASLGDEDAPNTRPPVQGDRAAWHAYALALQDEFRAAGYIDGDVKLLIRGYQQALEGKGNVGGKAPASSVTPAA